MPAQRTQPLFKAAWEQALLFHPLRLLLVNRAESNYRTFAKLKVRHSLITKKRFLFFVIKPQVIVQSGTFG